MKKEYPYQNLLLKNIEREEWRDIPRLEGYFMVSLFGRIKRLEYEMIYRNGAVYIKPEKIIKPTVVVQDNRFKKDTTRFLTVRVTFNGKRHSFMPARLVYYCFIASFDLKDHKVVILSKDCDPLNIHPGNLIKADLTGKAKRIVERERMVSHFKHLTDVDKQKQRNAIVKKISKTVSQYSVDGKLIRTYPSVAQAQRETGIFATSIAQRASGKALTAGGFIWRWGTQARVTDLRALKKEHSIVHRKKYGQKVTQYDLEGNRIACYLSLQDAEAASGANINAIRLVLKGVYKSSKGFFWKRGYGKEKINLSRHLWGKQSMAIVRSKKVKQLSLSGELIKIHSSVREAAHFVGSGLSVISATCRGKMR